MGGPTLKSALEAKCAQEFAGNYAVPDPPVVGFGMGYRGPGSWAGEWFQTSPAVRWSLFTYAHDLDRDPEQTGLADVIIGLGGDVNNTETSRSLSVRPQPKGNRRCGTGSPTRPT